MGQAVRAESKAIKMAEAHDCAKKDTRNNCITMIAVIIPYLLN